MNGAAYDESFEPAGVKETANKWIVGKLAEAERDFEKAMEAYRFDEASNGLYHFVWHTFCDWYLEFAKPLVQGDAPVAPEETRLTMGWALNKLLRLLHPIMPFITEELWQQLGHGEKGLLISQGLPETSEGLIDPTVAAEMDWVVNLITEIRGVRNEMSVPPGAWLPMLIKEAAEEADGRLARNASLIKRLARLSSMEKLEGEEPKGAVQAVIPGLSALLPLGEVIDLEAERSRLAKEIEKAAQEIGKLDKKLSNEQFLAKAPAEVVEENKARREAEAEAKAKLEAALERIA
jgi:valyl-tRNA synthetase